jgi:ABC-2 type transport system permease protein
MSVTRYRRLLWVQTRASFLQSMQYRVDFVVAGLMSFFWLGWHLIPLLVVFGQRSTIAGWTFHEALVLIGWFTVLRGILDGAINPALVDTVDRIRTGSFDYVLLKPADALFLVSTSRLMPWKVVDVLGGLGLVLYALARLGRWPDLADAAAAVVIMFAGILMLYSLWVLVICAAFWVVRLDNLTYMFSAVFDAARWPIQVFRGFWRFLFTFVLPLAVMTTYPAMALLSRLDLATGVAALAGAVLQAVITRAAWHVAVARYTSASS